MRSSSKFRRFCAHLTTLSAPVPLQEAVVERWQHRGDGSRRQRHALHRQPRGQQGQGHSEVTVTDRSGSRVGSGSWARSAILDDAFSRGGQGHMEVRVRCEVRLGSESKCGRFSMAE